MCDNGPDCRIENIVFPYCPFGIELVATQPNHYTHELSISHIRMNNYYFCAIRKDVGVCTSEIFDVIAYGSANGNAAYRGFIGDGRNPGPYPTGGSCMTDITMLTAERTWQLLRLPDR